MSILNLKEAIEDNAWDYILFQKYDKIMQFINEYKNVLNINLDAIQQQDNALAKDKNSFYQSLSNFWTKSKTRSRSKSRTKSLPQINIKSWPKSWSKSHSKSMSNSVSNRYGTINLVQQLGPSVFSSPSVQNSLPNIQIQDPYPASWSRNLFQHIGPASLTHNPDFLSSWSRNLSQQSWSNVPGPMPLSNFQFNHSIPISCSNALDNKHSNPQHRSSIPSFGATSLVHWSNAFVHQSSQIVIPQSNLFEMKEKRKKKDPEIPLTFSL